MSSNRKGFTLIEIIVVLVILGVLVAFAIPKYVDMQAKANTKALEGALAEGMSTCFLQYARLSLSNGASAAADQVVVAANLNKPQSNDFEYTFEPGADIKVKVDWIAKKDGVPAQSKQWLRPQP